MAKKSNAAPIQAEKTSKRRPLLVDEIIIRLQSMFSSGQFKAGEQIPPEGDLCKAFGVSRTTVREAVKVLSKSGLLEVQQGRGTFVGRQSPGEEALNRRLLRATMEEISEVRKILDTGIARFAAMRRTDEDLRVMRECLARRNEAQSRGDRRACVDADIDFHQAMARAGKNGVLVDIFMTFAEKLRDSLYHLRQSDLAVDYGNIRDEHIRLLAAIEMRDPDAAAACVDEYLEEIDKFF